jgi:hypothetical protein
VILWFKFLSLLISELTVERRMLELKSFASFLVFGNFMILTSGLDSFSLVA